MYFHYIKSIFRCIFPYDGLKDAVPHSSFVMLQNTECMEELYRPLSVPSVNDILTGEKIVEI